MKVSNIIKDFISYNLIFPTCVLFSILLMFTPLLTLLLLCVTGAVFESFEESSIFLSKVSIVCFIASITFYSISRLINYKILPNWINKYKSRMLVSILSKKGDRRVSLDPVQVAQALNDLHTETSENRFWIQVCYLNKHVIYDHFDPLKVVEELKNLDFIPKFKEELKTHNLEVVSFESKWWWYPSSRIELKSSQKENKVCEYIIENIKPLAYVVSEQFSSKKEALAFKGKTEGMNIFINGDIYTYVRKKSKDGYKRWALELKIDLEDI